MSFGLFGQSPGGTAQTTQVWLKANDGASNSAGNLTAWTNYGTLGAITLNGTASYDANGYNFNPKTHFNGNGNFISYTGADFGAIFAVVQLEDLSRVYTHLSTYDGVSGNMHTNDSWHGGENGGVASYAYSGYSTQINTSNFRTNGNTTSFNQTFSGTHEIIDVSITNGDGTIFGNRLLGGQYQNSTSGSDEPDRDWLGDVSEMILLQAAPSLTETIQIESYLAIKYGLTLGVNGTSIDYLNSLGNVVWDQSQDANYNWDIIGIARDDNSAFDQRKSHTEMFTGAVRNDILTMAYGLDFNSPSVLPTDRSYSIVGHDNGNLMNTGVMVNYPTDNGEIIETIFDREWLSQETGTVEQVTLEFDLNAVPGVGAVLGANDLANLRLLIDEDGDFSNGASSLPPTSYDNTTNIAYFTHDFVGGNGIGNGYYFTLGSVLESATPLPVELAEFRLEKMNCDVAIFWSTTSEINNAYFEIQKSSDASNWTTISTIEGQGNSSEVSTYSYIDRSNNGNGYYYYRLKQVDHDGTVSYSTMLTAAVDCNELVEPVIYPNPNNGSFNIALPYSGSYIIYSGNGKVVAQGSLSKGTNKLDELQLNSGFYTIKIESTYKTFVQKLIVR